MFLYFAKEKKTVTETQLVSGEELMQAIFSVFRSA